MTLKIWHLNLGRTLFESYDHGVTSFLTALSYYRLARAMRLYYLAARIDDQFRYGTVVLSLFKGTTL